MVVAQGRQRRRAVLHEAPGVLLLDGVRGDQTLVDASKLRVGLAQLVRQLRKALVGRARLGIGPLEMLELTQDEAYRKNQDYSQNAYRANQQPL